MQSEIEDKYSMDMVNKFYENCFTLIRYIGGTLVVLNGTGIVALLSLDIVSIKMLFIGFLVDWYHWQQYLFLFLFFMNPFLHKRSLKMITK